MKRETISEPVGKISDRHILEAETYAAAAGKSVPVRCRKSALAAAVAIILLAGSAVFFFSIPDMTVTACEYETGSEITPAEAVISTGTIDDTGEMTGHPLMFYLSGENIKSIRFSCKNQFIDFRDWTQKRDEYGETQNFTVIYGKNKKEYNSLLIDWVPENTIRELTDNDSSTITGLPENLRNDIIVMEITFENGKTLTKAVTVRLLDDGRFSAAFDDYTITENDEFIKRPDSEAIPREILYRQGDKALQPLTEAMLEAAEKTALDYYRHTVFTVNSISYLKQGSKDNLYIFAVNVSTDGIVQEPDRRIAMRLSGDVWEVADEGY